jgi:hypothetical protein
MNINNRGFYNTLTIHLVAPCLVCVVKHLIFVGGDVASCFGPEAQLKLWLYGAGGPL